jgi:GH24 family phage-related lysozyme (muramidase)
MMTFAILLTIASGAYLLWRTREDKHSKRVRKANTKEVKRIAKEWKRWKKREGKVFRKEE